MKRITDIMLMGLAIILAAALVMSAFAVTVAASAPAAEDPDICADEEIDPFSVAAAIIAVLGTMALCGCFIIRRR